MANSQPNRSKRLEPGSNFSLRLPQDIDSEVLAELNRHKKSKNFNAYATSMLLWAVEQNMKTGAGPKPSEKGVPTFSEADIQSAVQRELLKLLGKDALQGNGLIVSDNSNREEAATEAVIEAPATNTQPENEGSENSSEEGSEAKKPDGAKRRKNRAMGRGVMNSMTGFGEQGG